MERARRSTSSTRTKLAGLEERAGRTSKKVRRAGTDPAPPTDDIVSAALMLAAGKLLDVWRPRGKTKLWTVLRAGVAGAGAALLLDLLEPLLEGRPRVGRFDGHTGDKLLAGAGQGLLYGTVVEPRLPGASLLKGAIFGTAEYAADPAGGLSRMVGAHAPLMRVPWVRRLLDDLDAHERTFLEHLTFGIALALLYGSSPSSSGILDDDV